MKKWPTMIKPVSGMYILLGIAVVGVPIITVIEKERTPPWFFAVALLFCSMCAVHVVLRNMAERIEQLEDMIGKQPSFKENNQETL